MTLLESDLTYKLRGIFIEISRQYGYKFKENVYHDLCIEELKKKNISFLSKPKLPLSSLNQPNKIISYYYPDFVIENKIIMEVKSRKEISEEDIVQLLRYLKMTRFELGLLVNFGSPRVQIVRKILTNDRK